MTNDQGIAQKEAPTSKLSKAPSPKTNAAKLKKTIDVDLNIKAPIALGQELGRIKVTLNGDILVDEPLIALKSVEEGGFFKRLIDWITLFFSGIFS